jgi:predicted metal-dependent hydrolase
VGTHARSSLAGAFEAGARLFDDGRHWDAHEAWEERWRIETENAPRLFLQALIQLAAAFYKSRVVGDAAAAARLLDKAGAKLGAVASDPSWSSLEIGVELDALRALIEECFVQLERGSALEPRMIPRLKEQ